MDVSWIKKGLKDFTLILFGSFLFIAMSVLLIGLIASFGISPEYASTIISICLVFIGSLMFSYLDHKNCILDAKKNEIANMIKDKNNSVTENNKE